MDEKLFQPNMPGKLVPTDLAGYKVAFLPDSLPPNWAWPEHLWKILKDASTELARLDGLGLHMIAPDLLLRPMQRREAIKSSSLEGTYVSAQELLLFEIQEKVSPAEQNRVDDWKEVHNYTQALKIWDEEKKQIPVSRRVICKLHNVLMSNVRGGSKLPGEFRKSSVQIGKPARYIPPPAPFINDSISALEKYIHGQRGFDPLVDAFLVHYQFEAIHPFLDGNGRVGRLLLAILVQEWCGLSGPWLYMSEYFERNKKQYIDTLFAISTHGDWESWIAFCLVGVVEQTHETAKRCTTLLRLKREYSDRIQALGGHVRLYRILDSLFDNPLIQVSQLAKMQKVTYPTASTDIAKLEKVGILSPLKGAKPATFYSPEIFVTAYGD